VQIQEWAIFSPGNANELQRSGQGLLVRISEQRQIDVDVDFTPNIPRKP
jgi:hypothetical protein